MELAGDIVYYNHIKACNSCSCDIRQGRSGHTESVLCQVGMQSVTFGQRIQKSGSAVQITLFDDLQPANIIFLHHHPSILRLVPLCIAIKPISQLI